MTTVSERLEHRPETYGRMIDVAESVVLFLFTPLIGLAYLALYGIVGTGIALCFGLRAFGIRCGAFRS